MIFHLVPSSQFEVVFFLSRLITLCNYGKTRSLFILAPNNFKFLPSQKKKKKTKTKKKKKKKFLFFFYYYFFKK